MQGVAYYIIFSAWMLFLLYKEENQRIGENSPFNHKNYCLKQAKKAREQNDTKSEKDWLKLSCENAPTLKDKAILFM